LKLLTDNIVFSWVHEGRNYKKLSAFIACHQKVLDKFLDDFWNYYRDLLPDQDSPNQQTADKLRYKFWKLFHTDSGYQQLDERKQLTLVKISELLYVLEHPELPLYNNPAELGARTMVQQGNISDATQTLEGTQTWDTFMSLVPTTRKLGISFLNIFVTAFLRLGIFPVWRLLFTKNLLLILSVAHGCLNNFFPRSVQGIHSINGLIPCGGTLVWYV
jgi:hypothetical protein